MTAGVPTAPTARLDRRLWPQFAVCTAAAVFVAAGVRVAQLLGATVDWQVAATGAVLFIVLTGLRNEWGPPSRRRAAAPSRVAAAALGWLAAFAIGTWLVGGYDAGFGTAWAAGVAASTAFSLGGLAGMRVQRRETVELTSFTDEAWEPVEPHRLPWRGADVLLVVSQERERPYSNVRLPLRFQVQLFEPQRTMFGDRPLGAGPLRALLAVEGPARLTTSQCHERLFEQGVHVVSASVRIDDERVTVVLTDDVDRTLTIEAERAHARGFAFDARRATVAGPIQSGSPESEPSLSR